MKKYDNEMLRALLNNAASQILLGLKRNNGSCKLSIAQELDVTYSHIIKILSLFKVQNLVTFEKDGRIVKTTLTQKGMDVATKLQEIEDLIRAN